MDTFVVRVWRAADSGAPIPESRTAPLRGFVEHVCTRTTVRFRGGQELLRFLRDSPRPGARERDELPATPEGDR